MREPTPDTRGCGSALENQMKIAETLDLIKQEFDKFEEGLNKIL